MKGTKPYNLLTCAIKSRVRALETKGYNHLEAVIKAGKEYGVVSEREFKERGVV